MIDGAVRRVAEQLGNTPAVARRSYIDPRVVDRYLSATDCLRAPAAKPGERTGSAGDRY